MKKIIWLTILISTFSLHNVFAQRIIPDNSYNIYRQIKQLNNLTHVLYIAAHPDDENTRLLSYFVHEKNYKTYYLSLTRGEGGQNLIGQELGLGLGLIRNYELLAARDIDGADQLFTSTIDFGYSKNPDETFTFWNKEKIINETVDIIQKIRPDVIICRFPTTGEGGHGQHTASAIIARESFLKILESPELFHPERLLFNAFRFGNRNTINDDQFSLNTLQFNPGLGLSYGQLAGTSRSIHRSQGVGTPQSNGIQKEYFALMAGTPIQSDIIDRNISWERVQAAHITHLIDQIIADFDFTEPHLSIQALEDLKVVINKDVKDDFWKKTKLEEIDNIIIASSGLLLEALSAQPEVTHNQSIKVKFNAIIRTPHAEIMDVTWNKRSVLNNIRLEDDMLSQHELELLIDNNTPVTQPFWLKEQAVGSHYSYPDSHFLDNKIVQNPELDIQIKIGKNIYNIKLPIAYKYLHPTRGDVTEYLRITPLIVVNPNQKIIFTQKNKKNVIDVTLKSYKDLNNTKIQILNDKNTVIHYENIQFLSALKDTVIRIELENLELLGHKITIQALAENNTFSQSQQYIKYDHLPELVMYADADIKIVHPSWTIPNQKIGYIHGAGDQIPETMKNIGFDIDIIPESSMSQMNILKEYNTVILGIRAYNTLENINNNMSVLLNYVEAGGRLIVQYNTSNNLNTQTLGPAPFSISRNRVTEEDATVSFLKPQDPLLNHPHQLTEKDFENWVQERGLYFPADVSPEYTSVISMHDTGEQPLNNSLIYTRHGKGVFIYTGLSFFRQIPAGQTGAIKLLINCIELQ